ncbi:MAG TPA: SDR family oxidoreductase [Tissierellaceae bacterium]
MKNIIITGANQGIGYYAVRQLLEDKYNVTVLDLNIDNLLDLKDEWPSLLPLVCDVRDFVRLNECVRESVLRFGSVDCAIHNACLCTFDSMDNTDEKTFKDVFDVNYFGALNLTKAVIPFMLEQKEGKVIFASSIVGVTGFMNIIPYASSKGAIESLAKCLNIEYEDKGISFHIFHPPLTRTKSSEPLPVPKEVMMSPEKVGVGFAKNINKNSFIICHSFWQKVQVMGCYLFPIKMGKLLSKLTKKHM